MAKAQRDAARSSSSIQKSLGLVKAGVAGFVSGLSIGTFTTAIKSALDYAGSLAEVAQQIGVTTKDLQALRYMAGQVGVSQETLEKGLSKLTITLGQVAAGAQAPTKALQAIGISAGQLAGKDTGAAFRIIADGLAKIPDRAQRAAVEVALFGRAGAQLDNVLSGGSRSINEYVRAAEGLGLILSDADIARADAAADKFGELNTVLSVQWAGVVAENASSILDLAKALVEVVRWLGTAGNKLEIFRNNLTRYAAMGRSVIGGTPATRASGRTQQIYAEENIARLQMEGATGLTLQDVLMRSSPKPPATGGEIDDFLAPAGPKGKSAEQLAAEAERQRKEALRNAYGADQDQRSAILDELKARQDLVYDINDRAKLEEQMLAQGHEGALAQISFNLAMGDITAAQADKQRALENTVYGLKLEKQKQDEAYDIQQEVIKQHRAIADSSIEVKEMEASLAQTAAERRAIELKILAAKFAQLRQAQQDIIDDARSSPEEKNAAGRRLIDLDKLQAGATTQTLRGTMGPLESFLDSLPNTAAKANEALEMVAANGLQSVVDGLTDAMTGARSLGDVFSGIAKQIVADLIKIQIQKAISGGLSGALSGLGSMFSSAARVPSGAGSTRPSFATGGSFTVLGKRGVDTNLLSLNGMPIANVSHGERVSVANDNNSGRGGTFHIDLRGAVMTQDLLDQMNAIGDGAAVRGAMAGASMGEQRMARRARRRLA